MRVLLATFGTHGDVRPFVALGRALIAAGHEATLCGPPDHAAFVARFAVPWVAAGEPYAAIMAELTTSPSRVLPVMRRQVPLQFAALEPLVAAADVVLTGSLEYATPTLCEQRARPRRSVLLSPCMVPSDAWPMPALPFGGMPRWLNRLSWRLSDALAAATILSAVDEERGRRGLAPAGPASRHICGDEVLVPFPHTLGVVDDADVPVRQLGPWLLDDDEPLPAPVARFLDDGAPPVFFGLGSMPGAQELVGRFIEAARLAGVRALITGDGPTEGTVHCHPGPLPHARVFPRCAAVVHHGGAGTTTTALLAAVPQVLLPSVADQHHHGRLVHRAGLGPPPVPARRRQPSAIAAALRAALDTAPDRLSAAAAATRRDGLDEAVRVLEACAGAPSAA